MHAPVSWQLQWLTTSRPQVRIWPIISLTFNRICSNFVGKWANMCEKSHYQLPTIVSQDVFQFLKPALGVSWDTHVSNANCWFYYPVQRPAHVPFVHFTEKNKRIWHERYG